MEATANEFAILFETVLSSGLSAQEIVDLINEHSTDGVLISVPKCTKTVAELFSKSNISRFTKESKLVTRICNAVYPQSTSVFEGKCFWVDLSQKATEVMFRHPRKWRNCGKRCEPVILEILKDEGIFPV